MRVTLLRLSRFRNYSSAEMAPAQGLNLIIGRNGQGKTNLIEAVWTLTGARSPRAFDSSQLIHQGEVEASVHGRVCMDGTEAVRDLEARLRRGGRRSFRVNGKAVSRASEMLGSLLALWFSPDDLDVVRGAPATRRRFVDVILSQVDPVYRHTLLDYLRAVEQRTRVLRQQRFGSCDLRLLASWDDQVVGPGSEIVARRLRLLRALGPDADGMYRGIAGEAEPLRLPYRSTLGDRAAGEGGAGGFELPDAPALLRERFREHLASRRAAELARGATLVGPHRDDFEVILGHRDLRHFGSRGEQRTAAICLTVAAWRWMLGVAGEAPVLLLDDLMSELDPERGERLLSLLPSGAQLFVTAAAWDEDRQPRALRQRGARVWRVSAGELECISGR